MEPTLDGEVMDALWTDLMEIRAQDERPEVKPTHTYEVRILNKDYEEDWHWYPLVMQRIVRFCNEYEFQTDTSGLVANLQQSFISKDPLNIILAFFRDGELIGHLLADRSMLYSKPIVTVHQYMLDHGITVDCRNKMLALIKDWARQISSDGTREPCTHIQFLVRSNKLAKMYQRTFKAKPHLMMMRMAVEE